MAFGATAAAAKSLHTEDHHQRIDPAKGRRRAAFRATPGGWQADLPRFAPCHDAPVASSSPKSVHASLEGLNAYDRPLTIWEAVPLGSCCSMKRHRDDEHSRPAILPRMRGPTRLMPAVATRKWLRVNWDQGRRDVIDVGTTGCRGKGRQDPPGGDCSLSSVGT